MPLIGASVGRSGLNRAEDVKVVQALLNQHIAELSPLLPVGVSGTCDAQTILMIEEFQRRVLSIEEPDGRVDPGGRTIAALNSGTGAATPSGEPVLDGVDLPGPAAKVLKAILRTAGLPRARVTSGSRTPAEQARVMYENCVANGVEFNLRLYGAAGDKVVGVFAANQAKPRDTVIQLMLDKIVELGPANVSKHISVDFFVFDVAPSSIPAAKQPAFLAAINAHPAVSKVIPPPADPAYHIEIPKNSPHL
jgi:hypothetical protein